MGATVGFFKGILKVRYAIIALLAAGAWQVYEVVKPAPPPIEGARLEAVDEATADLVHKWPQSVRGGRLIVIPFERDTTGYVTKAMRDALTRSDYLDVQAPDVTEKVLRKIEFPVSGTFDGQRALDVGQASEVQYVLTGKVERLSEVDHVVEAQIKAELWSVGGKQCLLKWEYAQSPGTLERTLGHVSPMRRAVGWLLIVIILPWALYPLVSLVFRLESNAANAVMLVGFITFDGVIAWAGLASDASGWAGAFLILAIVFEAAYNAGVLNLIAGRR